MEALRNWRTPLSTFVVCTGLLFGCTSRSSTGSKDASADRFVPDAIAAEAALHAVFEAWRRGIPPGEVPETSPTIYVTDTFRQPGETLVDYRILGEVPSEKKRCYAVELRYSPERAERTRFLVVGIDPLWVFRLEDAENLAHWEHKTDTPTVPVEKEGQTGPPVDLPSSQTESQP